MSFKMVHGHHAAIMEASTIDDFRSKVIQFGNTLGFDTSMAITVVDHSATQTEFHVVDNTPEAYQAISRDLEQGRRDPVMQHCKNSSVPIVWDQATYVENGEAPLWEQQALHGFKTGVALALHLPGGRHFFLGMDRDGPLPKSVVRLTRIVAELQLFAVHAQVAGVRLFLDQPAASDATCLTPRETEALRWTMDGKTAWEVGEALNVSTRTAIFHLQNATRKLGCKSKFQAVLEAIRLGLLN